MLKGLGENFPSPFEFPDPRIRSQDALVTLFDAELILFAAS